MFTTWDIETSANVYARYIYSGDGQRTGKITADEETTFYHDQLNTLYETDNPGMTTASYAHTHFIDDLVSERKDTQTQFRLNDHLGSLRKMLDSNQTTTESITYDVFGEPNATSSSRFLFTGRELDSETSLFHYRFRSYNPSLGRFTSKDPLLFIDGPNVYVYVRNGPITFRDPDGRTLEGIGDTLISAISGDFDPDPTRGGYFREAQNLIDLNQKWREMQFDAHSKFYEDYEYGPFPENDPRNKRRFPDSDKDKRLK